MAIMSGPGKPGRKATVREKKKTTVRCDTLTAKRLLTYAELETEFGICRGTAYTLVHRRRIPHVRFGKRFVRFPLAEIELWLKRHLVSPAASTGVV